MNFRELKAGKSVAGEEIKAFLSTPSKKPKYFHYLIAATHGDEVEGAYVLDQFFDWLKTETEIDLPLVIIPIHNIDGYRAGTRTNANGVDLNRNFPAVSWSKDYKDKKYNPGLTPLSEPENIFLNELFKKYPPKVIFSFHSWRPFINYNGDGEEIASYLAQFNNYEILADIPGHSTPGSLGEFAPEKFGSIVITLEMPRITNDLDLKQIWSENETGLKQLFSSEILN